MLFTKPLVTLRPHVTYELSSVWLGGKVRCDGSIYFVGWDESVLYLVEGGWVQPIFYLV